MVGALLVEEASRINANVHASTWGGTSACFRGIDGRFDDDSYRKLALNFEIDAAHGRGCADRGPAHGGRDVREAHAAAGAHMHAGYGFAGDAFGDGGFADGVQDGVSGNRTQAVFWRRGRRRRHNFGHADFSDEDEVTTRMRDGGLRTSGSQWFAVHAE